MIRLSVPEIEGGYPERDGGGEEEEEGQVWGNSRKLEALDQVKYLSNDLILFSLYFWDVDSKCS